MRGAALRRALRRVRLLALDFDGVLTDNRVLVSEDGREAVWCSRLDGLGLAKLDRLGIDKVIISTETNGVVRRRARKLRVECRSGVADKLELLKRMAARRRIALDEVAFMGNDVNDADCLRAVGLPIVVADAHEDVRGLARVVTARKGGFGAVREICDLIVRARG